MAGFSIGMGRHVIDRFGAADADASIGAVSGVARRARRVSDQVAVDPDVVVGHAARGEALLEATPYPATIHRYRLHQGDPRLIDVVHDQAGDAMLDDSSVTAQARTGVPRAQKIHIGSRSGSFRYEPLRKPNHHRRRRRLLILRSPGCSSPCGVRQSAVDVRFVMQNDIQQ
jgi:hypothetical protein